MSTRRAARERALGLCYELDQRGTTVEQLLADLPVAPDDPYTVLLVRGVEEHRDEIDGLLREYSEHWALERMPVIDRALLRMATFELAHVPEVGVGTAISEAVELAKQYSTAESGRFVNGLLGRIAGQVRAAG